MRLIVLLAAPLAIGAALCAEFRAADAAPQNDAPHSDAAPLVVQDAQPRRPLRQDLTPTEAAASMSVPPGFHVQLAAGEPQVHQPVACAIDHRGRLWVAEAHTYPTRAPEEKGADKILVFEDTDQDGTLDRRKVFAENLNLVSGLEVGFGGVWVGAAPYLLFIPDRDGDDQPDGPPEKLLDGFGYQDTHETLNSFIWGPDGWLYGCHGVFTHSLVGEPGAPDDVRTPLNAGVWRYHPTKRQFEVFAWGSSNPWGVDFDDQGQAFITACVIPHLYHVIQGGRYQRQAGRHFGPYVFDDIKTIADHAHYVGNIRDHAWWGDEPIDIPTSTLDAGGGHAHCGAMIYLGNNWPAPYRGRIYMHNVHGNRINCDVLEPRGSGFVGRHGPDLMLANDRWFRGIALRSGPDGAVYSLDWYDLQACHRRQPEIWDRTNGRIYRISYGEYPGVSIDLTSQSDAELVELQTHANEWHVRTARRVLQERGTLEGAARERLYVLARDDQPERIQLRAMWTLHGLAAADEAFWVERLASRHPYVRAWAVQLALETRSASADFQARLTELARKERSPVVRMYLASALQRLPIESGRPLARALAMHAEDVGDHNLPLLLWYGIEPLVAADPQFGIDLVNEAKIPLVAAHCLRRLAADPQWLPLVVEWLADASSEEEQLLGLRQMAAALSEQADLAPPVGWPELYRRLAASSSQEIRELAAQVALLVNDLQALPVLRAVLADRGQRMEGRLRALEALTRAHDVESVTALGEALATPPLKRPALRALATFADERIPAMILESYAGLTLEEKQDALQTLASREPFALALMAAIQSGQVPRSDLLALHVRQLRSLQSAAVDRHVAALWATPRDTPDAKRERIDDLRGKLSAESLAIADRAAGRRLFVKHCASCHALFGEGGRIGPELTGSNRANVDYLLENLVDPSALVGKEYLATIVQLDDGRTLTGIVQQENDTAVTLQTATEAVVIAKSQIEQRRQSELSLMPEGLADALPGDELRDLAAYLQSDSVH